VVVALDRLGRSLSEITRTVEALTAAGCCGRPHEAQPPPQEDYGVASRLLWGQLEDGVLGEPLPVGVMPELVRAAGGAQQAGRMRPAEERDGPAWESPSP
jgi:hypothetical protein